MSEKLNVGFCTTIIEGNQLANHVKYEVYHLCEDGTGKVVGFIVGNERAHRIAALEAQVAEKDELIYRLSDAWIAVQGQRLDCSGKVAALYDQTITYLKQKDARIAELEKKSDRLLVLATKWCPKEHHDWQELLTY